MQAALEKQPWKEYTTGEGKKYWNNTETKESTWEIPEVYKEALEAKAPVAIPAPVA
jgi:pre-mRNA-processing factor 40